MYWHIKNYDDLRAENVAIPRVLVVVLRPEGVGDWCELSEEELILRRSAYWMTLRGADETDNDTSKTVYVPTSQRFDVAALAGIMDRISSGGVP